MQISLFISDSYSINLCLGYQLCLICLFIPLYFSIHLHRYPGIFLPNVWTLPSESCLPFCLVQVYSYLCAQGGDVTHMHSRNYHWIYPNVFCPYGMFLGLFQLSHMIQECGWRAMATRAVATYSLDS